MKRIRFTWVAYAIMICSLTTFAQPDTVWTRIDSRPGVIKKMIAQVDGIVCLSQLYVSIGDSATVQQPFATKLSFDGDTMWSRRVLDHLENSDIERVIQLENRLALLVRIGDYEDHAYGIELLDSDFELETEIALPDSVSWQDIASNQNSEFAVVGNWQGTHSDGRIIQFDPTGSIILDFTFGDNNLSETYVGIAIDEDRNVVAAGYADLDNMYLYVKRLDADGNEMWSHGPTSRGAYDGVLRSGDGGYVLRGYAGSGFDDAIISKVTDAGDSLWTMYFDGELCNNAYPSDIIPASGGGFFVCGMACSFSSPWIMKIDDAGDIVFNRCCWGQSILSDQITCAVEFSEGSLFLGGRSSEDVSWSAYLVRFAEDVSSDAGEILVTTSIALHPNYPNPFNATTEITFDLPRALQTSLKVYDVLGREVAELAGGVMGAGSHTIIYDASGLSSGVYFYRLEAGEFGETRKMVFLK